jgi:xanthine dehydrogenase accessory factor
VLLIDETDRGDDESLAVLLGASRRHRRWVRPRRTVEPWLGIASGPAGELPGKPGTDLGAVLVKDLLDDIDRWRGEGRRVALARVVRTDGSGPRAVGAAMAVNDEGEVAGSVSGGCVEGAVVSEALEVLDGAPSRLASFGYSDEQALAVGLTCGGTVELFIEELDW